MASKFPGAELVLAAETQIEQHRSQATVIDDLLDERRRLLAALRPFAAAAERLAKASPGALYRLAAGQHYNHHIDTHVVLIGGAPLTGYHFTVALDRYAEATRKPEPESGGE